MDRPETLRSRRKAATRRAVLAAARREFHAHGFDGATIVSIARAAGVSPGTVLNAAPTKIALLCAVVQADLLALEADSAVLAASLASDLRGVVAAVLELHLHRHLQTLPLITTVIGHGWFAEEAAAHRIKLDDAWTTLRSQLEAAQTDGALADGATADETLLLLQDLYLGVLRRLAVQDCDLFAASAMMRRRVDQVFDQVLAG